MVIRIVTIVETIRLHAVRIYIFFFCDVKAISRARKVCRGFRNGRNSGRLIKRSAKKLGLAKQRRKHGELDIFLKHTRIPQTPIRCRIKAHRDINCTNAQME